MKVKKLLAGLAALWLAMLLAGCTSGTPATTGSTITAVATTISASTTSAATTGPATTTAPTSSAATSTTSRPTTTAPASTTTAPTTTVAASPTSAVTTTAPAATTNAPANGVPPAFSTDRTYEHIKKLAGDIGIRSVGSENTKKAADYISQQYTADGLKASFQDSTFDYLKDNGTTVTVGGVTVPVKYQTISSDGRTDAIQGQVVYLENDTDASLLNQPLGSKIVVSRRNNGLLNQYDPAKNKAAALVLINTNPLFLVSQAVNKRTADSLAITAENGAKLVEAIKAAGANPTAKISANVTKVTAPIRNVVGVRPADRPNPQILVIGGHFDSVAEGPGANDNGTGTATIIELGRVMQIMYPDIEIRFIAFDGEEFGLIGSLAYVDTLSAEEKGRMVAMINIDMIAVGNRLDVGTSAKFEQAVRSVVRLQNVRDAEIQVLGPRSGGSDHFSFVQANIPSILFNRQADPNYHQPGDTPEKINPAYLKQVADLTLGILKEIL